jgi:hypothetical protein
LGRPQLQESVSVGEQINAVTVQCWQEIQSAQRDGRLRFLDAPSLSILSEIADRRIKEFATFAHNHCACLLASALMLARILILAECCFHRAGTPVFARFNAAAFHLVCAFAIVAIVPTSNRATAIADTNRALASVIFESVRRDSVRASPIVHRAHAHAP